MTIKELLRWGYEQLILSSSSARLDAELLLAHVLEQPVTFLLAHDETPVGFWSYWKYKRLIRRRKAHWPVAYLTGHKEFYFLDFEVNRHVLVPRPDTEILTEAVIDYINTQCHSDPPLAEKNPPNDLVASNLVKGEILPPPITALAGSRFGGRRGQDDKKGPQNDNKRLHNHKRECGNDKACFLLDVGTGSGCIAISVLKNVPGLTAIATDISRAALRVACHNAKQHHVADRLEFIKSDLLTKVPLERLRQYEVIVTANLPYVPKDFPVNPETQFEPDSSLYGGSDGTEIYKQLMNQLQALRPRAIFLECFDFQKASLATYLPGYELKRTQNLTGQARMMFLEKKS